MTLFKGVILTLIYSQSQNFARWFVFVCLYLITTGNLINEC